jgi:hypothetical protein
MIFTRYLRLILKVFRLEIRRIDSIRDRALAFPRPPEIRDDIWDLVIKLYLSELTMVSIERLIATANSVIFICKNDLSGAFVECGVWRGGNAILAAKIFELYGKDNQVFLYDTFEGMVQPTIKDFSESEGLASNVFNSKKDKGEKWCFASEEDVQNNFAQFGIKPNRFVIVKGDVCETLVESDNLPNEIAVLRLDTDWYDSTKIELEVLYPLVIENGIVIFDDYGYWSGHQKAIDEFFLCIDKKPFISYVDGPCRLIKK